LFGAFLVSFGGKLLDGGKQHYFHAECNQI